MNIVLELVQILAPLNIIIIIIIIYSLKDFLISVSRWFFTGV